MKTLTIIIPTYNMEAYLDECLDSLMTVSNRERMEVLIINDGSKDSSSFIAHKWCERHPEMMRVIDKDNGNYGSCINRGLKEATGKYVKILDADDRYDTVALQAMLDTMDSVNVDVLITDYVLTGNNTIAKKYYEQQLPKETVFNIADYRDEPHFQDIRMHSVAYRTTMLKDAHYHQAEGISFTDVQWIFLPIAMAQTAYYLPKPVYRYLIGRAGQTVDPSQKLKGLPSALGLAEALVETKCEVQGARCEIQESDYLTKRLMGVLKSTYRSVLVEFPDYDKERLKALDRKIAKEQPEIYRALGETKLLPVIGIRFISQWRQHDYKPLPRYYQPLYTCYAQMLEKAKQLTGKTKN